MPVHNHGTEEGKGLACRERMVNGELKGECMTDSLRDRIAAVIEHNLADQLPSDLPDRYYEWIGYDTLADAVIAALGLERQDHYDPCCDHYRYVTDWIAPND